MKTSLNTLGASNLSEVERSKNDYYGSNPNSVEDILVREQLSNLVWEPTAGHHNIVNKLEEHNYKVRKSDLVDYGFNDEQLDFLKCNDKWNNDIIMNPPYSLAREFIAHALDLVGTGNKVVALLRLQFLEGQKRFDTIFKDNPPRTVYVYVKRQVCSATDEFEGIGSAVAYCWLSWEKGFKGNPEIKWIS